MGPPRFSFVFNRLANATNRAFLATNGVAFFNLMRYIGRMKTYTIKRADGTVLVAEQISEYEYRLTLDGKPYNMTDTINKLIAEGKIKK